MFDYMTERAFFMELSEIITGQNLKEAVCSLAVGKPPVQFLSPGELEAGIEKNLDLGTHGILIGEELASKIPRDDG